MRRGKAPAARVVRDYDTGNLQAAMAILDRPECYGGAGSGPVDWAKRFLDRYDRERTPLLADGPTPRTILSRARLAGKPIAPCAQVRPPKTEGTACRT